LNKVYKYSLDKSSKKFLCPCCHKKTFVKFVDNETNYYLNDIDGRCDRESKCGYFKKPHNNNVSKPTNNNSISVIQPTYHHNNIVSQFSNTLKNSNFIIYLMSVFDKNSVLEAIKRYNIGITNYWNGATVFWQIDIKNRIRGGKIMLYNSHTGQRIKKPFNHISWIHKQLKIDDFKLSQCLYGLHNIANFLKGETICIVESEKTAIIMSIVMPSFLWMATGSKAGFKESMLQPVKAHHIIAYPDKTEFEAWSVTAQSLNKNGFSIQCSGFLEKIDVEIGGDLVDYLMENI